jgi:hypothetical protein
MNEVLANLYAVTGEPTYLETAKKFEHRRILDPLARGVDPLDNVHANTQIPKIIGVAREYELTATPGIATSQPSSGIGSFITDRSQWAAIATTRRSSRRRKRRTISARRAPRRATPTTC